MPAQTRCKACERYEAQLENFCRVCGFEFRPQDDAPLPASGITYAGGEKYCGHCGCTRGNCHCAKEIDARQLAGSI